MLSIVAALGSALLVAVASVLQHRAGSAPGATLRHALRHPLWIVGALAGVSGFGLHVIALSGGSLSIVQPLLVTGLLFALPLGWILDRSSIRGVDLGAAVALVAGLILFQLSAGAAAGSSTPDSTGLAWCAAATSGAAAVGLVVAAGDKRHRASWLGFCAGASYGLVAALLKATVGGYAAAGLGVLTTWPPYAFLVLVIGAIAVNQLAFNAGPLAASLPLITIVDPVVSVAIGAAAFGETIASGVLPATGQLAGAVLMSIGVLALSRCPADGDEVPSQQPNQPLVAQLDAG